MPKGKQEEYLRQKAEQRSNGIGSGLDAFGGRFDSGLNSGFNGQDSLTNLNQGASLKSDKDIQ